MEEASDPVGQILKHNFMSCMHLGVFSLALRGITTTYLCGEAARIVFFVEGSSHNGQKLDIT